ncbi:MAG TPA: hypothetical protein VEA16_07465 [Vicinamibacterales bacterium]|nr:hypothetical protein [Vicinamibacterales bacterium]
MLVVTFAAAAAGAQEKKVTVADFAGTWNIEVMSHQIALVIEAGEGNTATGTMMAMGRDTLLKGELVDRTITFIGVKSEANANVPAQHQPGAVHAGQGPTATPKPIVVTLQEDGTLTGEMMTNGGPVKWSGEKLRTRKKG